MKRALLIAGASLLSGCADILGLDFEDKRLAAASLQVLSDTSLTGKYALFGISIDLDGDTLLIGGPQAAYVYERQANGKLALVQKLERPTGPVAGTRDTHSFGNNVAVHGDWAMIADWGGSLPGEVFVFKRGPNGFVWTEQKLQGGPGRNVLDRFGWDIAIDGDTAAIGAHGDNERTIRDAGAVYVYTLQNEQWLELEKLTLANAVEDDRFGAAVALENDTLVTSAQYRDEDVDQNTGAIYVYSRRVRFGDSPPEELAPSGADPSGQTLEAVGISGDALLAGAPNANGGQGLAFAYQRSDGRWGAPFVLPTTNAERATLTPEAHFGIRLAVDGNLAVVTTLESGNNGAGYIYRRVGGNWQFRRRVSSERADAFGYEVKVQGSTIAIGAMHAEPGAVYVYEFPDQ